VEAIGRDGAVVGEVRFDRRGIVDRVEVRLGVGQHDLTEAAGAGADLEDVEARQLFRRPGGFGEEAALADARFVAVDLGFAERVPLHPEIAGVVFGVAHARNAGEDREAVVLAIDKLVAVTLQREAIGRVDDLDAHAAFRPISL